MKKIAFILILCCTILVHAADEPQAGEKKSALCTVCHGAKGVSINPEWPSLAGQHADYLVKQLQDFKSGKTRPSAVMMPLVADLSEQDMNELGEYYASLPLPEGETPKQYLSRGEQLYRGGDFKKHITACIACHGPRGTGNSQAGFPVLSGQQAVYTTQQLEAFKHGKRSNDLNAIMRDISKRMSKKDMEAVSHYVAGLH